MKKGAEKKKVRREKIGIEGRMGEARRIPNGWERYRERKKMLTEKERRLFKGTPNERRPIRKEAVPGQTL